LQRCVDELAGDPAVRVLVLAGRGSSFCAGGDLTWMREQGGASEEDNLQDARQLAHTLRTLAQCPKPTLARVHGVAIGGGVGLVAACDLAIASRTAVFATPEARLGLTPSTITPYVVAAMGQRAARRWFLTGERFDAAAAERVGLVSEAVDPQRLDRRCDELIQAILQGGPQALSHCKWLLDEVAGEPVGAEELEETVRSLASIRAGEEAREGIEAFFARRSPAWVTGKP
jgi:methylglutaconyl-CoA hydratase